MWLSNNYLIFQLTFLGLRRYNEANSAANEALAYFQRQTPNKRTWKECLLILITWARSCFNSGHKMISFIIFEAAVEVSKKDGDASDIEFNNNINMLLLNLNANNLIFKGELLSAQAIQKSILPLFKSYYGDKHAETGMLLRNMAVVLSMLNDYEGAEKLYKQALKIFEETWGRTHNEIPKTLIELANLYYNKQNYTAALAQAQRALDIRHQHLGDNHVATQAARHLLHRCEAAISRMNLDKRCHPNYLPPFDG